MIPGTSRESSRVADSDRHHGAIRVSRRDIESRAEKRTIWNDAEQEVGAERASRRVGSRTAIEQGNDR